jgi:hypothetical protein
MNIAGADNFPENVRVIDDGDSCSNAEHGATAQDLSDRTRWLKNALAVVQAFVAGGAATLANNHDYTLANGKVLTFKKGGVLDNLVNFSEVGTRFNGKVVGKLFTAGLEGVANKKILRVTSGSGDFSVEAWANDTVIISGISGARTVVLGTPAAGSDGHHVRIVNESATFFVSYKPFGGANMGSDLKYAAGQMFSVDLVWSETDGAWHITGYGSYLPGS